MKKLLALVLCVMLFVSVIPTSAFAKSPKKIDLKPAVDQMNHLYEAYGDYFGQTTLVTIRDMFKSMADQFDEGSEARKAAVKSYKEEDLRQAFKKIQRNDDRFSAEGLFNRWGWKHITRLYNSIVSGAREDTIDAYIEQCEKIEENIAAESAKIEASIAAAVASAFPPLG